MVACFCVGSKDCWNDLHPTCDPEMGRNEKAENGQTATFHSSSVIIK